jgi:ADP-ribosylglycohydrolase
MAGARALQADVDDGPPGGLPRGDRLAGLLLGTALGDALGLPAEGLSRRRIARLGWNGRWRQRFLCGRGMTSDDTEHTVFVAESLLRSPPDPNAFARLLAWRLRLWLLAVPAGIGFATRRACLKLWLGFPPSRSGVYSAGNGPAMRAAIIGAWFAGDRAGLDAFVRASTTLTHTDPRAFTGALAVALCAESAMLARDGTMTLAALTESAPEDAEWQGCLARIRLGLANGWKVETFCRELGCPNGVSGYIYQTVPVAVFAFSAGARLQDGAGGRARLRRRHGHGRRHYRRSSGLPVRSCDAAFRVACGYGRVPQGGWLPTTSCRVPGRGVGGADLPRLAPAAAPGSVRRDRPSPRSPPRVPAVVRSPRKQRSDA